VTFWDQFIPRFENRPRVELRDNPRVKKWVQVLLDHRDNLEHAAGGPLGAVLGCGHYGCVVQMPDPWVLKLTIDPTEAHIWSRIVELEAEEVYGQDGFTRVKRIFELKPGIRYGGKMKRVYGIVREKIAPAFWTSPRGSGVTAYTIRRLGLEWTEQYPPTFSHRSLRMLDVSSHPRAVLVKSNIDEFYHAVEGLLDYRRLGAQWHEQRRGFDRDELRQEIQSVINEEFGGPIGGPIGESLGMLLDNDVVLRDTHLGNIGWRVVEEIDGDEAPLSLVIFDPGHTPTAKRSDIPVEEWQQFAAYC
jgi:hypothetical protein